MMDLSIKITPQVSSSSDNLKEIGKHIAYFNEYLKNRMDFLADIATSRISSLENPMLFYQEVLKGISTNKILLDRISGISGNVKFTFEVLLNSKNVNIESKNDFYVSMPNDILGCQAFYIIIENIIRNICKHSKKDKLYFKLCIDIAEPDNFDNYFKVEVYPKFYDDIEFSILQYDSTNLKSLVNELNGYLNQSILGKETNSLRDKALGTIEMDICSAYLRKRDIVDVEDDDNNLMESNGFLNKDGTPNFLYTTVKTISENNINQNTLVQNFHIRKPRQILVIDSCNVLGLDGNQIEQLHKDGIWILSQESEFINKNKYKSENIFPHEILVYLDSQPIEEFIAQNRNGLSLRILNGKDLNINNVPKDNKDRCFEEYIWSAYSQKSKAKSHIIIDVNNNCNPKNEEKCVFIDDHSTNYETILQKGWYYDMGSSHHRANAVKTAIKNNSNRNATDTILIHKYTENIFTKIVLLDERIQSNIIKRPEGKVDINTNFEGMSTGNGNNVDLYKYFIQQNLIIPNYYEADLNQGNFGSFNEGESISFKVKTFLSKQNDANFIVIHMGLLEKMLPEKNNENQNPIEDLISESLAIDINKVIITSGRGQPKGLPNDIKFIPLSSIQNAVESLNDKFLLTQILYNARKYKY